MATFLQPMLELGEGWEVRALPWLTASASITKETLFCCEIFSSWDKINAAFSVPGFSLTTCIKEESSLSKSISSERAREVLMTVTPSRIPISLVTIYKLLSLGLNVKQWPNSRKCLGAEVDHKRGLEGIRKLFGNEIYRLIEIKNVLFSNLR